MLGVGREELERFHPNEFDDLQWLARCKALGGLPILLQPAGSYMHVEAQRAGSSVAQVRHQMG